MTSAVTKFDSVENQAGTSLEKVKDLSEVIERAGFDFEVEKVPAHAPEGGELDGLFLLRRADTKAPMNIVRGRYQPVSNREMFEPFDEMVREFGGTYENAGLVRGGRTCWLSAKLPGDIVINGDDKLEQRIVGMAHHDGMGRNSYFQYSQRVWCNNMLRSLNQASNKAGHSIRHTTKWQEHLGRARLSFNNALISGMTFHKQAETLSEMDLSKNQAECFLQNLYPVTKETSKPGITRTNNRREHVLDLFHNGMGNKGQSRWDMLNAVTEYYDHHVGNKKSSAASRFMNNMTGMGPDRYKQQAFSLLLNDKKFLTLDPERN